MDIKMNDAINELITLNEVKLKYLSLEGIIKTFTCRLHNKTAPSNALDYTVMVTDSGYPTGKKRQIWTTGILEFNNMKIIK
jgi:hypothetical protein